MSTGDFPAYLVLEDGQVFEGLAAGAAGLAVGMLRVDTSMTGYEKSLVDADNVGALLVFTTPHIGNCGRTVGEAEASVQITASGVIVRDLARRPSNYQAKQSLGEWLAEQGTVGIREVDTRALTRHLRKHGVMRGAIVHGIDAQNFGANGSDANKSRETCLEKAMVALGLSGNQEK